MDGAVNMIREFSSDFDSMQDQWKYVVYYCEDGVEIEYWETKNGEMFKKHSMNICALCAELLFKTIAKDFDNGEAKFY